MIINYLLKIRAYLNRIFIPKKFKPLSSKFGYDRGTPIDRYWIEKFLDDNKHLVKGSVLEITDSTYTKKHGRDNVKRSDVLDINILNKKANIHGDLRNLKEKIKDNTYDCIILTHVLGLIDDYDSAIKEMRRILKPNGVILYTGSCIGPILGEKVYWRFTPNAVDYIFKKNVKPKYIKVNYYGNILTGQAFWVGMAQEDLSKDDLDFIDERYPCIVTAVVKK